MDSGLSCILAINSGDIQILAQVGLTEEPGGRKEANNYNDAADDVFVNMARTEVVDH